MPTIVNNTSTERKENPGINKYSSQRLQWSSELM